jgi:hypothetical protein
MTKGKFIVNFEFPPGETLARNDSDSFPAQCGDEAPCPGKYHIFSATIAQTLTALESWYVRTLLS